MVLISGLNRPPEPLMLGVVRIKWCNLPSSSYQDWSTRRAETPVTTVPGPLEAWHRVGTLTLLCAIYRVTYRGFNDVLETAPDYRGYSVLASNAHRSLGVLPLSLSMSLSARGSLLIPRMSFSVEIPRQWSISKEWTPVPPGRCPVAQDCLWVMRVMSCAP